VPAAGGNGLAGVEHLLAEAVDKTREGLVVCDKEGTVRFANAPARALMSSRGGDLLAQRAVEAALATALAGSPHEETLDLYSPTRHSLEIKAFPLYVSNPLGATGTEGRDLVGAVALVEDVSELRRLEAVRRDFVANLSHELKTPLGALSLLAEALDGEEDPEVVARLISRIGDEARRFSRLVDDLLDLSRIEAGGTGPLTPEPLGAVVGEAAFGFAEQAASRGIKLEVDEAEPGVSILANRRDLASAIANLVDNAIKYSEPGGTVRVSAGQRGERAYIAVRDEGIGIPKRDQERIFERFYRVDRARSRWTGGTGLGLAIVRHVAAYHGGEVTVESTEGAGSTFTLTLPLAGTRPSTLGGRAEGGHG
jgi:two-component system sensor histidine kinase SenX3